MRRWMIFLSIVVLCGGALLLGLGGRGPSTLSTFAATLSAPTQSETPEMGTAEAITQTLSSPTLTGTPTPLPPPLPLRDDLPSMELRDWPRPPADNGLGLHFIASGYYDEAELDKEIARMRELHLKWALVLYADENHLELAARKFKEAGIMVVWRKTLRPYQRYSSWGRDVEILNEIGMPPYLQLYNEPELPAEWDGRAVDRNLFFAHLLQATKDVYNAGGYPGWQFLDEDDLRQFITEIYARNGAAIFRRMFFVPHAYGLNHPPNYIQDNNGVLGFRTYATIFFRRLGFVPPFIVGEGGWKVGSQEDMRFLEVDEQSHRDYTLAVADWFRTGRLSNGGRLPDYMLAFNFWMIAGSDEAGAWYDAFNGDRELTIEGMTKLTPFVRRFSWNK